ncbi:MAG: DNA mismatch repair protein MutS [Bacteroidetes bacterium]|jgi:DNA mismatch repair ATPase MutS|nr:DNA mismatch repair protein MutS [Bacteroidota bacterium]
MKALLLYKDRDFETDQALPWNEDALTQDLSLNTLFEAMAGQDKFVLDIARKVVLSGSTDLDTILYRQEILRDCLRNPSVLREAYQVAVDAIEEKRKSFWAFFSHRSPGSVLYGAIESLQIFVSKLKLLRNIADEHEHEFRSSGFSRLVAMLRQELTDEYFEEIESHLRYLRSDHDVLVSAKLGAGNKGTNYILRKPPDLRLGWLKRVRLAVSRKSEPYTFHLDPRDERGAEALGNLRDRGINLVANALAQSADHIQTFFNMLRTELGFYLGCLNLYERLNEKENHVCFPIPSPVRERRHSFSGLYDTCLALTTSAKVVGNGISADGKNLVIITGANQGGKSTFLRSIGLAQLMMQAGMFVSADSFTANLCSAVFTHYKREEDTAMESGKFDEELSRMSRIADHVTPDSLLLFNESFAATNEREGSEIARQIVTALLEGRNKVFFVTHLYSFAGTFYEAARENTLFLRAQRLEDGTRTFKLEEAEPLETSFGQDLYERIVANSDDTKRRNGESYES